jgi:uncharacterized membrane protein YphA (DoxX/SURF4 family)
MKIVRTLLFHTGRLVLGAVFVYAGWIKASDVSAFAGQVAAYQLLPYTLNYLVAATLPYIELLSGALLLLNLRIRPALLVLGLFNLGFMAALVSVMLRGLEIDCGCFDPTGGSGTSPGAALLRDLALMGLVVMTWLLKNGARTE